MNTPVAPVSNWTPPTAGPTWFGGTGIKALMQDPLLGPALMALLEKEKEILKEGITGKPDNVVEKIVEGKLQKFYEDRGNAEGYMNAQNELKDMDAVRKVGAPKWEDTLGDLSATTANPASGTSASLATQSNRSRQRIMSVSKSVSTASHSETTALLTGSLRSHNSLTACQ